MREYNPPREVKFKLGCEVGIGINWTKWENKLWEENSMGRNSEAHVRVRESF